MNFDHIRFGKGRTGDHDELGAFARGTGSYTSDNDLPGQLHACFVRATEAHAAIRSIDPAQALALPGVHAVITGAQLQAAGIGAIPALAVFNSSDGKPMANAAIPPLAIDTVRHVGEAMAMVVADSAAIAQDAADLVQIDLDSLPVVATIEAALEAGAPRVWPHLTSNVALDWADGDLAQSDAAFAKAFHIESVALDDPPLTACALEPRAAIAQWTPDAPADGAGSSAADTASSKPGNAISTQSSGTGNYTLIASTQGVMVVRKQLAESVLKIAPEKLRVITPDVGGGFGAKVQAYPEYAVLLFAAKLLRKPVKWTATRLECFLTDTRGRDSKIKADMAFDHDGRILGIRADAAVGIGAYTSTYIAIVATNNTKNCLSSVYRVPSIRLRSRMVFTHHSMLGAYRGAGRPEAIYLIERLLDRASAKFGLDRAEIRRRNLIPASAMPYSAVNGQVYDSGEFEVVLDKALKLADWNNFSARRAESASRGLLRGIGMCNFLEVAGGILEEPVNLNFGDDGTVSLHTGAQSIGQGHLATYPLLIAKHLGIDVSKVRLVAGDSAQTPGIVATVASRSTMMTGGALTLACDEAIRRGKLIASHLLEASASDIEFAHGKFSVAGTDVAIPILEITPRLRKIGASAASAGCAASTPAPAAASSAAPPQAGIGLPEGIPTELSNLAKFVSPGMSFPNGCHICEVEVDPDTGLTRIVRYTAVDDVGVVLNSTIVEGQVMGGIAQGLGQVFGEQLVRDDSGQVLNASFMDYPMPHAGLFPTPAIGHHEARCTTNPLGVKGAGESGVSGALPSAVNAILDALSVRGVKEMDLPFTPGRVWAALQRAA